MAGLGLLNHASTLLDGACVRDGGFHHEHSGVYLLRHQKATPPEASSYQPLICLVLQGAKEVATHSRRLTVRAGQSLIISHSLPIVSRITAATVSDPYVALVLPLDLDLLRTLALDWRSSSGSMNAARFSISLRDIDPGMHDAFIRYLKQSADDTERRLLAPITHREIHARLLLGPQADMLQKLIWHESTASRIYQATQDIITHLTQPMDVGQLAQRIGMSPSAFFEHFKAVTGTTPLQYQKDFRLLRARNDLRSTNKKVNEIAFAVGYESSAQFSREYGRKFGRPPREDRESGLSATTSGIT